MVFRLVLVLVTALLSAASQAQLKGFEQTGNHWTFGKGETSLVSGVLYKPEGSGPFPAILISHGRGGSAAAMANNLAPELVKRGIVCIAVDYTHGRTGSGKDEGSSAENIRRAKKALEILRSLKYVDGKRIAAFGHSMGAFLTIGLAADPDAKLQAAVISAGGITSTTGYAAPDTLVAKRMKTPMLMLHGDNDNVVPAERSLRLKEILDENKVPNERKIYTGEGHNIIRTQNADMISRLADWLKKHGVLES